MWIGKILVWVGFGFGVFAPSFFELVLGIKHEPIDSCGLFKTIHLLINYWIRINEITWFVI